MISSIIILPFVVYQSSAAKWDYDENGLNISHWDDGWEECGASHQSPIDIQTTTFDDCTSSTDASITNTHMSLSWTSEKVHYGIRNNGHSVQAIPLQITHNMGSDFSGLEVLHHTNDTRIRLKNLFYDTYKSRVNAEYCFDSLHFHWGKDDLSGSEHTVNGKSYPLEVHLVHYSCDYETLNDAVTAYLNGATAAYDDENILAVIGVFFEIGDANPVIERILSDNILNAIHEYHNPERTDSNDFDDVLSVYYTEFDVNDLLPTNRQFYGYEGSLTTPPCLETVRWHVMKEPVTISSEQMAKFRQVSEDDLEPQAPNFRPPQPLNDRQVYYCEDSVLSQTVEKEELPQEPEELEDEEPNVWRSVGLVFIVAFVLSCMVIIALLYRFRNDDVRKEPETGVQYKRAASTNGSKHELAELQRSNTVDDI